MSKGNSNSLNSKSRSSKPYDVTNSYVKRIKDRMTSYLPRFGLSLSTAAVEGDNAARPPTIRNDSSSEDDEASRQQFAPPKKRARSELNQPLPFATATASTPNNLFYNRPPTLDFIDGTIAGPSGINRRHGLASSTPAVSSRFPLEPNLIQASEPLANGDNDSNSSMSTSGCSSLIPQTKNQAENNKSNTSVNNRSSQRRGCFGDKDMSMFLQSPRSMLDGSVSRANSAASGRRPSFNASVFSAPSPGAPDSSPSVGRSPFYAGRTQFGGASSYRRPRGVLFTPLESMASTSRQTVQAKPLAGSSTLDWGSCTARKILDTLDHLSSPVLDAKRIPSSPVLGQSRKRPLHSASPGPVAGGPAIEELTVPTVQDLLKMQRQNQMRDSMEAARKVALSPALNPGPSLTEMEREYRTRLDSDQERPTGGKMTSKMRLLEAEMSPAEPRLPSISLSMVGLPTFEHDHRTVKMPRFTFTRPTPLNADEFALELVKARAPTKKPTPLNNNRVDVKSRVADAPPAMPIAQFSTFPTSAKLREKSGYAEMSKAAAQNGKVGFATAVELRTGSVMDILGKKPTSALPAKLPDFGGQFKPAEGSWSCDSCLVQNAPTATACAACTTARPLPKTTLTLGFGTQFKPPAGSWSCDACDVRNQAEVTKCVACATARAPAKAAPLGFGLQFKPPAGSWSCGTCNVQNQAGAVACMSCQTAKTPPQPASVAAEASKPTIGFGEQFKPAVGTWECKMCLVPNKPDTTACVSCSAARPASTESSKPPDLGFGSQFGASAPVWECPSCRVQNGNGSVACIACEMRKPDVCGFMAKPSMPSSASPVSTTGSLSSGFGSTTTTSSFTSTSTSGGFGSVSTTPGSASTVFVAAKQPSALGSITFGAGSSAPKETGFGAAFKKAAGDWDCDVCSLRNKNVDVCMACEAARPGLAPTSGKPAAKPTPAPTFAFGIDKAGVDAKEVPSSSGFSFGTSAPAPTGGFTFGIPAKTEAPKLSAPTSHNDSESNRKRKSDDESDGRTAKSAFGESDPPKLLGTPMASSNLPVFGAPKTIGSVVTTTAFNSQSMASSNLPVFGAPKTNGPVATTAASRNLFAFGTPAVKTGTGFGAVATTSNPFTAATNSTSSSLFTTTTSSACPTTNMCTKTASSFTPTTNLFTTVNSEKPAITATNFFANTANRTMPAASPFAASATSAPSAVFAFGSTTQTKPAADSTSKVVTFGSNFGSAKPSGSFGSPVATSLGFPSSNVTPTAPAFGAPAVKTSAPFLFGQAAKSAEKTFPTFSQTTEPKGFNFAAAPTPNASTGFGFGAAAPAAPGTFAFAEGSAPAPAGGFPFGQPAAFNPGAAPQFNFTGGETPQFTAAGVANPVAAGPRRIIKKAVRRNQR